MSKLGDIIRHQVHRDSGTTSVLERMSTSFTRIKVDPKQDFDCTYEVSAGMLTIVLRPISDYGDFIMQKTYDAECKEELDKK